MCSSKNTFSFTEQNNTLQRRSNSALRTACGCTKTRILRLQNWQKFCGRGQFEKLSPRPAESLSTQFQRDWNVAGQQPTAVCICTPMVRLSLASCTCIMNDVISPARHRSINVTTVTPACHRCLCDTNIIQHDAYRSFSAFDNAVHYSVELIACYTNSATKL